MHPLRFLPIWLGLIFGGSMVLAQIVMPASPELTRIQQLTSAAGAGADVNYSIHLEGVVLWADPQAGKLVLQDRSGVAELELDWRNPSVRPGQLGRVAGTGTITHLGGSYRLGVHGPVVDNDGVHWMQEKSGAVYLAAGRHPLRVEWFNGVEKYGLDVEYSGPGLPRQKIPDASLFRPRADFLLRVRGLSMINAGILDGDLLAVHRSSEARNGQIVVARLEDDVTVKRFRQNGDIVELIAENPDFEPIIVDTREHSVEIEGIAVGLIRGGEAM